MRTVYWLKRVYWVAFCFTDSFHSFFRQASICLANQKMPRIL